MSATLNTTVAAPIPNASDSTTAALKPGVRRTERKAYSRSWRIPDSHRAPHESRVSSATSVRLPNVRRACAAASAPLSPSSASRMEANRDLYRRKSNRVLRVLEFRYDQAVAWREEVRRMVDDGSILVTGAAGQLGSVGRTVTGLLLDRGFSVRAMVRREDERAASLRAAGAKVVVGDLLEPGDVYRVVSGCCRVYFIMSIRESRTSIASRANLWFSISRNLLMQVGI